MKTYKSFLKTHLSHIPKKHTLTSLHYHYSPSRTDELHQFHTVTTIIQFDPISEEHADFQREGKGRH